MERFLTELLRMSLFGSLSAALLLFLRPVCRRIVSPSVIYYLWLLVLLRLCIPAGITITLPASYDPAKKSAQDMSTVQIPLLKENAATVPETSKTDGLTDEAPKSQMQKTQNIYFPWIVLWGLGSLLCLGWHVFASLCFSCMVRHSLAEASPEALAVLRELEPSGRIGLAGSPKADTPMLLGFLRPVIILPAELNTSSTGCENTDSADTAYVSAAKETMLRDIIAHELVHARHCDLLYKWFVTAVTSLHWFNPLMLLIKREISHCCELSCDESVIRGMNAKARRHYGETLLAMAGAQPFGTKALTAGLCEEKSLLKERLVSIVKYRKKSVPAILFSTLFVLAAGGCAMISNAEAKNAAEDFLAVLTENTQFIYHPDYHPYENTALPLNLSDILDSFSSYSRYSRYTEIYQFTTVDLDNDGEPEVLLQITDAAADAGGYLILRRENGEIYGYPGNYKAFTELKTDGTFTYISLAAPDTGIGTVRFHENGYTIIPLACSETSEDFSDVAYQIDGKPVSEAEYLSAFGQHRKKADAIWYSFTDKNIQALFDGSSSASHFPANLLPADKTIERELLPE